MRKQKKIYQVFVTLACLGQADKLQDTNNVFFMKKKECLSKYLCRPEKVLKS